MSDTQRRGEIKPRYDITYWNAIYQGENIIKEEMLREITFKGKYFSENTTDILKDVHANKIWEP